MRRMTRVKSINIHCDSLGYSCVCVRTIKWALHDIKVLPGFESCTWPFPPCLVLASSHPLCLSFPTLYCDPGSSFFPEKIQKVALNSAEVLFTVGEMARWGVKCREGGAWSSSDMKTFDPQCLTSL